MEGYLLKTGHFSKAWKLRYFVFDSTYATMKYYEDNTKAKEKGIIHLYDGKLMANEIFGEKKQKEYSFEIYDSKMNKKYLLSAALDENIETSIKRFTRWTNAIRTCILKTQEQWRCIDIKHQKGQQRNDKTWIKIEVADVQSDTKTKQKEWYIVCKIWKGETVDLTLISANDKVQTWTVRKIYNDFVNLNRSLRTIYAKEMSEINLPSIESSMGSSIFLTADRKRSQQKKDASAIHIYIQEILSIPTIFPKEFFGSGILKSFMNYTSYDESTSPSSSSQKPIVSPKPSVAKVSTAKAKKKADAKVDENDKLQSDKKKVPTPEIQASKVSVTDATETNSEDEIKRKETLKRIAKTGRRIYGDTIE